jgi:hypothetical protein
LQPGTDQFGQFLAIEQRRRGGDQLQNGPLHIPSGITKQDGGAGRIEAPNQQYGFGADF